MRRDELAHLLRAAATIAGDGDILVVGSQAILGSHSEEELPEEAWISIEADLVFLDRWPPVSRPPVAEADRPARGYRERTQNARRPAEDGRESGWMTRGGL